MALPAVAVGAAVGAAPLLVYGAKAVYDSIVEDDDPDSTFSLFAQPPTMNMPGKDAKGADPLTAADEQYMVDKLSGAPAKRAVPDLLGESPPAPDLRESPPDPDQDFAPLVDDALPESAPAPAPRIIPDGDWQYKELGDGRFEIVGTPPGSRARGMVLDPMKIALLPDGATKARLTYAYNSIKSVSEGGQALPRHSTPKKPAPPPPAAAPAAQPALPPPVSPDVDGIPSRTPAFGVGREPAVESSPTPSSEPYGRVRGFFQRFKDKPVEGGGAF